jgi:hypothetical protein
MDILKNALDSIDLGLEDYLIKDSRRLLSCTRNIYAGILLLFKHKLAQLSPPNSAEVLIKNTIRPEKSQNGEIIWIGAGKRTVDVNQIQERFKSIGIQTHWDRIEEIRRLRNDIEHYYTELSKDAIRGYLSNSFIVIRDFLAEELATDPSTVLAEESWATLVSVSEVYDKEKQQCLAEIKRIDWTTDSVVDIVSETTCEICGSGLITIKKNQDDHDPQTFECKTCHNDISYEDVIEQAIIKDFSYETYLSFTDGGNLPIIQCPECNRTTYVYSEKECKICGYMAEHTCSSCAQDIVPEELDGSGLCGWCAHMINKDD